jgi:hypothetical protein
LDLSTASIKTLSDEISSLVRAEPASSQKNGELHVKMLDLYHQEHPVVDTDTLLRDLCWTHDETITIRIDPDCKFEEDTIVYFWREPELAQEALTAEAFTQQLPQREHIPLEAQVSSSEKNSFSDANSGRSELTARSNVSLDAAVLEGGIDGAMARLMPHFPPEMVSNTQQTRQFEFHPSIPQVVLIGDQGGGVNVVQTDGMNVQPRLLVDTNPIRAMSWMHHHPHCAVCGVAETGRITFLRYDSEVDHQDMALHEVARAPNFESLSSLSVNCTDDFLLVSGLIPDLALYDIHTGQLLHHAYGVHSHGINVSRFSHRSPHILATASFDQTCKLWDIRQPLSSKKPTKVLQTGGPNIMCAFSPSDKSLLCSGIDTHLVQYDLPSFNVSHKSLALRPETHQARYRRSMYLATGQHFVTSATQESYIRIMSASGINLGIVDFRGQLRRESQHQTTLKSAIEMQCNRPQRFLQRSQIHEEPWFFVQDNRSLVHGDVRMDTQSQEEYVQTLRTHPTISNCVGVLLSSSAPNHHSCLSVLHLAPVV